MQKALIYALLGLIGCSVSFFVFSESISVSDEQTIASLLDRRQARYDGRIERQNIRRELGVESPSFADEIARDERELVGDCARLRELVDFEFLSVVARMCAEERTIIEQEKEWEAEWVNPRRIHQLLEKRAARYERRSARITSRSDLGLDSPRFYDEITQDTLEMDTDCQELEVIIDEDQLQVAKDMCVEDARILRLEYLQEKRYDRYSRRNTRITSRSDQGLDAPRYYSEIDQDTSEQSSDCIELKEIIDDDQMDIANEICSDESRALRLEHIQEKRYDRYRRKMIRSLSFEAYKSENGGSSESTNEGNQLTVCNDVSGTGKCLPPNERIHTGKFSIELESGWSYNEFQGIDSHVGQFAGRGVNLSFDYGWYSNPLALDSDPDHEVSYETIGGVRAKIVVPRRVGDGITGVYFDSVGGGSSKNKLQISGRDLSSSQQAVALRMFRTISFVPGTPTRTSDNTSSGSEDPGEQCTPINTPKKLQKRGLRWCGTVEGKSTRQQGNNSKQNESSLESVFSRYLGGFKKENVSEQTHAGRRLHPDSFNKWEGVELKCGVTSNHQQNQYMSLDYGSELAEIALDLSEATVLCKQEKALVSDVESRLSIEESCHSEKEELYKEARQFRRLRRWDARDTLKTSAPDFLPEIQSDWTEVSQNCTSDARILSRACSDQVKDSCSEEEKLLEQEFYVEKRMHRFKRAKARNGNGGDEVRSDIAEIQRLCPREIMLADLYKQQDVRENCELEVQSLKREYIQGVARANSNTIQFAAGNYRSMFGAALQNVGDYLRQYYFARLDDVLDAYFRAGNDNAMVGPLALKRALGYDVTGYGSNNNAPGRNWGCHVIKGRTVCANFGTTAGGFGECNDVSGVFGSSKCYNGTGSQQYLGAPRGSFGTQNTFNNQYGGVRSGSYPQECNDVSAERPRGKCLGSPIDYNYKAHRGECYDVPGEDYQICS